jgi:ferredoxin, 2Fe-2S
LAEDDDNTIRVDPTGVEIDVRPGESVYAAARRQGYRWASVCGGEAMCGSCFLRVTEGAENTSEMEDRERVRLRFVGKLKDPANRLGCQMTITGPVTGFKRGVRKEATNNE